MKPTDRFGWDLGPDPDNPGSGVGMDDLGKGRDIELYKSYLSAFLEMAREEERPFWLMVNTHDPHRPFYGSGGEEFDYPVSREYLPEEIEVPGFLPDLPDIRTELAAYYTSAHRADDIIGAVLDELDDAGFRDNTLVMFLSDNGASFPFAKANTYLNSTKTPWIVRLPGVTAAGSVDSTHFISGIDYMPTVLEAAGLAEVPNMDGHSFLSILSGARQGWRNSVFTEFNKPYSGISLHMRGIQNREFGYIYNPFHDHQKVSMESMSGLTWAAMVEAGQTDPAVLERVDLFRNRVPEELYAYNIDPDGLVNLIHDSEYAEVLAKLRQELANEMYITHDSLLWQFEEEFGITGVAVVIGCLDENDQNFESGANKHDSTMCSTNQSF